MAVVQRKLVHKQFNSPIGLYSQQNVKETLDRELKAFGSKGIEVDEQITKPLNLANSAVLRAVEEEDQQQINCGYKRVAWPPVSEEQIVREFTPQPVLQSSQEYYGQPVQQQQQQKPQPAQYRASSYDKQQQSNIKAQEQQQHQQQQSQYPTHPPHPKPYEKHQKPPLPYQQEEHLPSWAHNQERHQLQQQKFEPASPPPYQTQEYQQSSQTTTYHTPQHQTNEYHSYSQLQQQHYSQDQTDFQTAQQRRLQDYRSASPGIIQLRKETPISQKPAPVYNSQPVALSLQGGTHMRGDLKWPPPEYKEAAARENEERRKIAMGPVCRPRKVQRDYTPFFAKNSLSHHYASYKVPPGTQHIHS